MWQLHAVRRKRTSTEVLVCWHAADTKHAPDTKHAKNALPLLIKGRSISTRLFAVGGVLGPAAQQQAAFTAGHAGSSDALLAQQLPLLPMGLRWQGHYYSHRPPRMEPPLLPGFHTFASQVTFDFGDQQACEGSLKRR